MPYVLIVDDEPLIRASLTKKVSELGSIVSVAGNSCNGEDALMWLEKNYADICITDVRMPVMDGLELIRNINQKYPWMVSLIISSYDDFDYARQGIKLGVIDYILKPVDQNLLNEAINKACETIYNSRISQAYDILIKNGFSYNRLLVKLAECIKSGKSEKLKEIAEETMDLLRTYYDTKAYLAKAFAIAWLKIVEGEIAKEGVTIQRRENAEIKTDKTIVRVNEAKDFFDDCARKILIEGYNEMYTLVRNANIKRGNRYVEKIKEYINQNYNKQITLQDLADCVEMSRTYISNLFKNETGITLWNYLLSVRMEKAAELIKTTNLKIYEIGLSVGYENSVHFIQMFKEYYGVSPSEYRKV